MVRRQLERVSVVGTSTYEVLVYGDTADLDRASQYMTFG
jgi:hypothetical protein